MSKINRKVYSPSEKATIALEALKGNLTLNEITKRYGVHFSQINKWKKQLKESVADVFSKGQQKRDSEKDILIQELYKKIGQLEIEKDWLKKKIELFDK